MAFDSENLGKVSIKEYFDVLLKEKEEKINQRISDSVMQREQRVADVIRQHDQQLADLNVQLQHRFEAQEKAVLAAFINAERATIAALNASEKAVNKAEQAQALRNEAQNEFRASLADLSNLMWTSKEGTAAVEALRRELTMSIENIQNLANVAKSTVEMQGALQSGTAKGIDKTTGMIVTVISSGAAIMGIIAVLLTLLHK